MLCMSPLRLCAAVLLGLIHRRCDEFRWSSGARELQIGQMQVVRQQVLAHGQPEGGRSRDAQGCHAGQPRQHLQGAWRGATSAVPFFT